MTWESRSVTFWSTRLMRLWETQLHLGKWVNSVVTDSTFIYLFHSVLNGNKPGEAGGRYFASLQMSRVVFEEADNKLMFAQ